ncbi:hypothetical protein BST61_g4069 [Cercospora zeina]
MPSCTRSLRTLCRSRRLFVPQNNNRLPQWRRLYSTSTTNTTAHPRRDAPQNELPPDANGASADSTFLASIVDAGDDDSSTERHRKELPPDLNHVSAESTFLDFILGPSDNELPKKLSVSRESYTRLDSEVEQGHEPSTAPSSRRERRRRLRGSQQLSHEQSRQSPTELNDSQKPLWVSYNFRPGATISEGAVAPKRSPSSEGRIERNNAQQQQPSRRTLSVRRPPRQRIITFAWRRFLELKRWTTEVHQLCACARAQREAPHPVLSPQTIGLVDQVYAVLARNPPFPSRLPFLHYRVHAHWPSVALWFMHYDPRTGLDFLLLTNCSPGPLARLTSMTIQCLATIFVETHDNDSLSKLAKALPGLTSARYHGMKGLFSRPYTYEALSRDCTDEALSILYNDFKKHHNAEKTQIWRTWLVFAAMFSRHDNGTQALDALLETKNAGGEVNFLGFRKVSASLLRRSLSFPGGLRACIGIVDALMKLGVSLNNEIVNVIVLNAVEAGDLKTAMDVYHSMRDHGLQPDMYTFAILLKACKTRIDDAEMLNDTINDAIRIINVLEAPVVATEILHCLALHHTRFHLEKSFLTLADAYAQLFALGPLRLVRLLPDKLSQADETTPKPQPRVQDIQIMLDVYLEQCSTASDSVIRAYDLWQRFKHAMESGQEPFASMAQTDHVFNAFLGAFTKTKRGLLRAAEIIKYMQLPNNPDAEFPRIRPTVQTWSIFLYGFSRHGQVHLAEQVLTYMRSKGIEPNLVTHNSLLVGHALTQDLDGVLRTVQRMQTDGHIWDSWTQGAIQRYRDQDTLRARMQGEALDFTAELKMNLGAKIGAFIQPDDPFIRPNDRSVAVATDRNLAGAGTEATTGLLLLLRTLFQSSHKNPNPSKRACA